MATEIKIDAAQFDAALQNIMNSIDSIISDALPLSTACETLSSQWIGDGKEAFEQASQIILEEYRQHILDLQDLHKRIETAKSGMQQSDEKIASDTKSAS